MQALSNLLAENRALMIGAAAVAFFVAAVLILLVFRLAFGRRLRMPGGRARQMRLGIVDAFDLDRQRQLVIVRRDNVEHLVMIGGPNDILIELQIIRTEARPRDKDMRGEPAYVQGPAPKQHTEPRLMPEPQPVNALEDYSMQNVPQRGAGGGHSGPPPSRRGGMPGKMPSVHEMPPGAAGICRPAATGAKAGTTASPASAGTGCARLYALAVSAGSAGGGAPAAQTARQAAPAGWPARPRAAQPSPAARAGRCLAARSFGRRA